MEGEGEQQRLIKMPSDGSTSDDGRREMGVRRYLTGMTLLFSVVMLWVISNFITASLETGNNSWNKPFMITYIDTASFVVYLLPTVWRYRKDGVIGKQRLQYEPLDQDESLAIDVTAAPATGPDDLTDLSQRHAATTTACQPRLTIRETAEIAAWWSAVWFLANWTVNASLGLTSVASVTILSSTSGFFTLALGRICGVESLTRLKVFAVVASFLGVILVTQSDSTLSTELDSHDLPSHPILGDLAALLSAAFYAVYVILLKVRVGDEDRADMQLMLGFAGLFNIICMIPVFPILHYTGVESFQLPNSRKAWLICLTNACITVSSDYLYVLAMLKTTPMVATIGLSLAIPLSLVGSLFIPDASAGAITVVSLLGAMLVCTGFGLLGWQGWVQSRDAERRQPSAAVVDTSTS